MYDDDGSGNVEAAEIIKWVRKAQVQGDGDDIDVATQAQTILSAFDNNNNASIDFEEFKVSGACTPWQWLLRGPNTLIVATTTTTTTGGCVCEPSAVRVLWQRVWCAAQWL